MATLRNKTTEAGIIVRWKSHPDHSRPSTYQVTGRAVSFLEGIGFRVPSAGDETEIPWGVCRPLRVLGDLHFKSETPGEVETGSLADVDDDFGRSLTTDQQERLRTYIETHPNYGATSRSLEGELSSLPETKTSDRAGSGATTDGVEGADTDRTAGPLLGTDDVVIGRVDRLSSSGNAMLKTDAGEQYNLGPLPEAAVGEVVPAAVGNGTWALCLATEFWTREYLVGFSRKREFGHSAAARRYLRNYETDGRGRPLADHDAEIGDVLTVEIAETGGAVTLGRHRETLVTVDADVPLPAGEVTVEVVDDTKPLLSTAPTTADDALVPGEPIDVVVNAVDDRNGYCLHDGTLVVVPGGNVPAGTPLRVAITAIEDDAVTASVAALPEAQRPRRGDAVRVEDGVLVDYDAIPVELPPELEGVSDRLRLEVTDIGEDCVAATGRSWELLSGASAGDEVDAAIVDWHDGGTIATVDGVPLLLDGFHGNYGGRRRVELTGLGDGWIRADVAEPIQRVAGDSTGEYLESMQRGHWRLDEDDCAGAADAFSSGTAVSRDDRPLCWADARACFAYALAWSLARDGRLSGSHDVIAEARADLRAVESAVPEAVTLCSTELEILEHAVYAVESWSQRNRSNVSSRKARATAKREIRAAVEKSDALVGTIGDLGLTREAIHPLVVLAIGDTAGRLDGVHDSVSAFLDEHGAATESIDWTPLAEIERPSAERDREPAGDRDALVEPFDASREPSEELSASRSRAAAEATPADDAIAFRNATREYRRSDAIREYVRRRAAGVCEACGEDAPFEDTRGRPYLEFHHVDEFEMTGPDVPSRVVALCPTCHARVHAGADGVRFNGELRAKLDDGLGTLGA